jgi:hypothetical protein
MGGRNPTIQGTMYHNDEKSVLPWIIHRDAKRSRGRVYIQSTSALDLLSGHRRHEALLTMPERASAKVRSGRSFHSEGIFTRSVSLGIQG